MGDLRMDVELAPDLVEFFNSKFRNVRQELDRLQKENESLKEENHNLKAEVERLSQASPASPGEGKDASENDAAAELIETRHALAGSNREVQTLAFANRSMEVEIASLRAELDAIRNHDQDKDEGSDPPPHATSADNSERNWDKLCTLIAELGVGRLQLPGGSQAKETELVQVQEVQSQPSGSVPSPGNSVEASTSGSSRVGEVPDRASTGSESKGHQTSPLRDSGPLNSSRDMEDRELEGDEASGSTGCETVPTVDRVRFALDGPGPEASIPCVSSGRKGGFLRFPEYIKKMLAPCGWIFSSPSLTIYPAHGRPDCARVIDATHRYRLTDGGGRVEELSHLSKGVVGSAVDLFHEQNGGICYLGTYEYTAISQISPADFKELSHVMCKAIINVTLRPQALVSAAEREHAVRQYLAGELHAQYADLQFMTYNKALYNALQAWKNQIHEAQKQPSKRKADDSGDMDMRKKARV